MTVTLFYYFCYTTEASSILAEQSKGVFCNEYWGKRQAGVNSNTRGRVRFEKNPKTENVKQSSLLPFWAGIVIVFEKF